MGASSSKANKKKCGVIDDAQQVRIDSSALHCPICLNVYQKAPGILPCGHSHCMDCLERLNKYTLQLNRGNPDRLSRKIECPICRAPAPIIREHIKNYAIEAILDSLETYKPEDDPTNDIIASLNLTIKRLNLDNRELQQKVNELQSHIAYQRKFCFGLLSLLTIGVVTLLIRALVFA